jgi:putative ABC transport system permease protein
MSESRGFRRAFRLPGAEGRVGGEVDEEISFHVEERTRELVEGGMDPEAARAEALREFGDVSAARTELEAIGVRRVRRRSRASWWSDLGQDLAFGARTARRAPLFTLLAVLTLALGIGANAAVFGVVKSVLLDALPYRDADRLMQVYGRTLDGTRERSAMSAGTVTDLQERQRSFEELAGFLGQTVEVVHGGEDRPRVAQAAYLEPELFRILGVAPAAGRVLLREDVADTARAVMISHAAWQRLHGGDRGVIGSEVTLNGIPRTVVGLLPREFVAPMGDADFYLPLSLRLVLESPVSARGSHWLQMIGRLEPGVEPAAARDELVAIGADIAREHPESSGSVGVTAMPLREAMAGDTRTPLLLLLGSAALVLLIACANLAGALLSRAIGRRREFAVRVAMGAGRGRLVRQMFAESLLLAAAGGAMGLALALGGLALLRRMELQALPAYADLTLDLPAVALIALLSLLAGLTFGVAPAIAVGRAQPQATLREESRGASESRRARRLRGVLVSVQITLCLSLLAGAGLLGRSLWVMATMPLGFDADRVLALSLQLSGPRYGDAASLTRYQHEALERLRALPGAAGAASVTMPPTAVMSSMGFTIDGQPPPAADAQPFVLYAVVSDDYFRTLRVPLRQGRVFDAADHEEAPPTVVVSETMARRYWPGGDAVGSRIRMGPDPSSTPMEVIGVVGDVRNDPALADSEPMAYRTMRQAPWPIMTFLVRTTAEPLALARAAEAELAVVDPAVPVSRVTTLRTLAGEEVAGRRLPALLMSAFGLLALLLAAVGVYAMFASMAAAREREFGVRMALGSSRVAIVRLVLGQGALWMLLGLAGGLVGFAVMVPLLREMLFGVEPFDPFSIGLALLLIATAAATALMTPVRRATGVDPAVALRGE